MSSHSPIISIVLPVCNEEKYIRVTLDSLLSQTFSDFEIVVVNDGSIDKTGMILEEYSHKEPRIKIVNNQFPLGLVGAINRGIDESSGSYIARIDAGDRAAPDRLQKQFDYLEKNKESMVVGSWCYLLDKENNTIGRWITPLEVNRKNMYKQTGVIHSSSMMRKELFSFVGKYNPNIRSEDFELWIRIIRKGFKITNIPEFLVYCVEREEGLSLKYFFPLQISLFKIKLQYLFHFFDLRNCLYTLRSLGGVILCLFLPKKICLYLMNRINRKQYKQGIVVREGFGC